MWTHGHAVDTGDITLQNVQLDVQGFLLLLLLTQMKTQTLTHSHKNGHQSLLYVLYWLLGIEYWDSQICIGGRRWVQIPRGAEG